MSVNEATKRLVWVKAGGLCAFAECRRPLIESASESDTEAQIGEVAHIVGRSELRGPRSTFAVPGGERDAIGNLLLLCPSCHSLADSQPQTYTVERLVGIKETHERWVFDRLRGDFSFKSERVVHEDVHSTFMSVDKMPRYVFTAPCDLDEPEVRPRIRWPSDKDLLLPYLVRDKQLISFWPLTEKDGPFEDVVSELGAAERHESADWWKDPDLSNWYVTLLNRSLNKLTGRRGLNLDKEHHRYYFDPEQDDPGDVDDAQDSELMVASTKARLREVEYRSLSKNKVTRSVAWQPVRKSTGELRGYWIHLAVGLRFHRVSSDQWVLSVRPEHRFTVDGFEPLHSKGTSRRATSKKAHLYNVDLLADLQFWRDYLSQGAPNIIMKFGQQHLILDTQYSRASVAWPGVKGDAVAYANATIEHDLFSSAAYHGALDEALDEADDDEGGTDDEVDNDIEDDRLEEDGWDAIIEENEDATEDLT
jgi:hypothetical protein